MKRTFLLFQILATAICSYAQNVNYGTEYFSYGGNNVNHYGLGWYNDPAAVSFGPMGYLSAYGGLRFFTAGTLRATLNHDGNLGINTDSPTAKLHIINTWDPSNNTVLKMVYQNSWGTADYATKFRFIDIASTEGRSILQLNGYGMGIGFDPPVFDSSDRLYVNGNIGIATTDTKGYRLAVNGNVIAESVTVKANSNWPDYVLKKDYPLPPLAEVKAYIEENHHLADIPSEKEIVEKGLDLGKINKSLVKKVEELTLYLIDKDKNDREQQSQIKGLQSQIDLLKKQVEMLLTVLEKNRS